MLRRFIVPFVICSVLLASPVLWAQQNKSSLEKKLQSIREKVQSRQNQLDRLRKEKEKEKQKIQQAKQREKSILTTIKEQREQLKSARENYDRILELVKQAEQKLDKVNDRLTRTRRELGKRKQMFQKRLRAIYKQGELMHTKVLLGATSPADLITRSRYYQILLKHDRSLIKDYKKQRDKLERLRNRKADILEKRKSLQKKEQSALKRLEASKKQKQKTLKKVKQNKELSRKRYEELEKEQERVKNMVYDLTDRLSEVRARLQRLTHKFGQKKGKLRWPVDSCEIVRPFGKWEERGIVHKNDGIDIAVNEGEKVHAVASGKVMVSRPFRGMGKIVILIHGGKYVTLYGSLVDVKVKPGQDVPEGGVVGRAGQTAGMDQPRLYFQIFKGRDILNPNNWLNCSDR
ncbi:MAG: murein hydrolase activator EnvC [bacterium]